MALKRKDAKKWITADDAIFTGGPYDLALAFLCGYVDEHALIVPTPKFKFLRPGSAEEARAREALVQVLRSHTDYPLREVLLALADLFDAQGNGPRRLYGPHPPQRKLEFRERSSRRQSHVERDWSVAWFIFFETRMAKEPSMEAAVAAAIARFGGSRAYMFRVWKKYGRAVTEQVKPWLREQPDDAAGKSV